MATVDSKGRIVLPKEIRERLGITPGTEVDINEEDGKVIIVPVENPEQVIERMERLITETSSDRREMVPLDKEAKPITKKHRDTIKKGTGE